MSAPDRPAGSKEPERASGGPLEPVSDPRLEIPLGKPSLPYLAGYWVFRVLVMTSSLVFHRLRIGGSATFPAKGGVLLVSNHQSHLDVPYLTLTTRRVVHFLARRSLMGHPLARCALRCSGSLLADRDGADREAFAQAVSLLRMGEVLCVFPEGTRSPDGRVHPFKRGAELIARRAAAVVVPAAIAGTYEAWPRHRSRPRAGRIRIELGRPIPPEELARGEIDLAAEVTGLFLRARRNLGLPDLDA